MSFQKLPDREYFALKRASKSLLDLIIDRTPAHAKYALDHPDEGEDTKALAFGRLVHQLILEPEKVIAVVPVKASASSNAEKRIWIDWLEEKTGKTSDAGADLSEGKMLSARIAELRQHMTGFMTCCAADYETACRMRDSIMSRSIGQVIFSRCEHREVTALGTVNGVECKSKIDAAGPGIITDLKTGVDATPGAFSRSCERYRYHRQHSFYRRVYAAATGEPLPEFFFIVVEKTPPYDVGFYQLDRRSEEAGDVDIDFGLAIWDECEKSGIWPGSCWSFVDQNYEIQTIALPEWALRGIT